MKPHLPVRLLSFLVSSIGISLTVAAQDATIAIPEQETEQESILLSATPVMLTAAEVESYIWSGTPDYNVWSVDESILNFFDGVDATTAVAFENGIGVEFGSSISTASPLVQIVGTVAPGNMVVNATTATGSSGSDKAVLQYGYAFTGDSAAHIADYKDAAGNVITPTSITNKGASLLVLDTQNTFSGGITLESGSSLYLGCAGAAGAGVITMKDNTKVIVNHNSSDSDYRAPSLDNRVHINGNATISYGTAAFGDSQVPFDWKNVSINGGVTGSGTLELWGYTYSTRTSLTITDPELYNYVSAFSINEQRAGASISEAERFKGTVYLKNEYNNSSINELAGWNNLVLGGAVQLTLVDDVFSKACINLTRDVTSTGRIVGSDRWSFTGRSDTGPAQTSDNILVLSDNKEIALRALESEFIGSAWKFENSILFVKTIYQENYSQANERWHVRVVTDGNTTLVLDGEDATQHVFSGSMGFNQSYTQSTQGSVELGSSFNAGQGSLGTTTLSLDKRGSSEQYIHTANLVNLSLSGGTLGFNHLTLSGDLSMSGGTTLKLGVTGVGDNAWTKITGTDYDTNSTLSVPGNVEIVNSAISPDSALPTTAKVDGDLNLSTSPNLVFNINGVMPSTNAGNALLDVNGTFTLPDSVDITMKFSGVNLSTQVYGSNKYYLVSADSINYSSSLVGKTISLGYGYYGRLDFSTDAKYLYMQVVGDPRRTWSGMLDSFVWKDSSSPSAADSLWKENRVFDNGQLVLFGNLYRPKAWEDGSSAELLSSHTVLVTSDKCYTGNTISATETDFAIDSVAGSAVGYQKVQIVGEVAPASIVIGSNYTLDGVDTVDDTDYYFFGDGTIREVDQNSELYINFAGEKTNLRKAGTGTAVIATNNSFTGGTILENGRIVMQHRNALGTGGVQMMHGAVLQGDFADDRKASYWPTSYGNVYTGEGMQTTTVTNAVTASVYIDPDNTAFRDAVDARIANAHDKKMVLTTLIGDSDTVVTLYGSSLSVDTHEQYTYAVFKVLNPNEFYGTLRMDGNVWGGSVTQDLWGAVTHAEQGGRVQLEIMTKEKAAGSGNGNWLNTTIDLSVENGTERTVLGLDALETTGASAVQVAQVNALQGISHDGSRINSSVLNMSEHTTVTLQIMGTTRGDYDGVLGFGDFQKTVDYDAVQSGIGYVNHHYGCQEDSGGVLNVQKDGNATQSVNSAWLNELHVTGGTFMVDEMLVVHSLVTDDTKRLIVGDAGTSYPHSVVVGSGGVLSFDSGMGEDAFTGIGAGVAKHLEPDSSGEDVEVAPSSFVLLADGATLSAHDDWFTNRTRNVTLNGSDVTLEVGIDIATGATVTVNTHHFTPDASIDGQNDVFGTYGDSHVIHLLGAMQGKGVHLIFNNEQISAAALADGSARKLQNGLGYDGEAGSMMGYVAIRDIHQFTGDILVEDMTVLQVANSYTGGVSDADMAVEVSGKQAALQILETAQTQYLNELKLSDGGALLLGGELKTDVGSLADNTALKSADYAGVQLSVSSRSETVTGTMQGVHTNLAGAAASIGGADGARTNATGVHITAHTSAGTPHEVHDANLIGSLLELKSAASVDLSDNVLIDKDSVVFGSLGMVDMNALQTLAVTDMQFADIQPAAATETISVSKNTTLELTTSAGTIYQAGNKSIYHVTTDSLQNVNVEGDGLTLRLVDNSFLYSAISSGAAYAAIQIQGVGQFDLDNVAITLLDSAGNDISYMMSDSAAVSADTGATASIHMLYIMVPEPATASLGLLALAALATRRRRRS
ncbi:MAG: hypothetical protein Q4A24_06890 [Akkermansia sp.]|nr:hypothetical protein [Akkermansia sp.]